MDHAPDLEGAAVAAMSPAVRLSEVTAARAMERTLVAAMGEPDTAGLDIRDLPVPGVRGASGPSGGRHSPVRRAGGKRPGTGPVCRPTRCALSRIRGGAA